MKKSPLRIFPSIFGGDFGYLADEAKRAEEAGADGLHIDIMDGHFVPNLTLGPRAVEAINRATALFLEVHIMVYNPFNYIEQLAQAGADRIIFHFEATEDIEDCIQYIRKCRLQAGLAFNPDTSASMINSYIDKVDSILLMTVHPGFGGQAFIPAVLDKVRYTRELAQKLHIRAQGKIEKSASMPPLDIGVDGGVTQQTAEQCVEAGANVLVSGSFLYHQKEMQVATAAMKSIQLPNWWK